MEIKPFKMRPTPATAQIIYDIMESQQIDINFVYNKVSTMRSPKQFMSFGIVANTCVWRKENRWFKDIELEEITPKEFIKMYGDGKDV